MGKISPVSAKYIIHTKIEIDGVVDKPDVIGAIFGQTEGLLGAELELRELQRSGRIGRIEVDVETRGGKTNGAIIIPSSLDKAETSIIGAALEIIQRIGPCNARIAVINIEDVRISKRKFVVERAKELLKQLMDTVMPDSQEIADEVAYSVRVMEIQEYGRERLPAGPAVDESDEIIIVEGRADVLNLLKHGIKNAIAINGTNIPPTITDLCKAKTVTAFVDGDRGGDLIIQELTNIADIDFVTKAPDGKEVEEITKKEIHKALRSRISVEQAKLEISQKKAEIESRGKPQYQRQQQQQQTRTGQQHTATQTPSVARPTPVSAPPQPASPVRTVRLSPEEKKAFGSMTEDLIGTRGAYILDEKLNILGKVPSTELASTLRSLKSAHAIVLDGIIDKELVMTAEKSDVKYLVGMDARIKQSPKVTIVTASEL